MRKDWVLKENLDLFCFSPIIELPNYINYILMIKNVYLLRYYIGEHNGKYIVIDLVVLNVRYSRSFYRSINGNSHQVVFPKIFQHFNSHTMRNSNNLVTRNTNRLILNSKIYPFRRSFVKTP